MLHKEYPAKVKIFFGFIFQDESLFEEAAAEIVAGYGPIDTQSLLMDFTFTDYYGDEMGSGLKRKFVSLEELFSPEDIVAIKDFAIDLERRYAVEGKRRINIDPGYLTLAKVVLSTTKDFAHRIYLRDGIFAEVTLLYKDKKFVSLPWTFPDYKTSQYQTYFYTLRDTYKRQAGDTSPGK